MNILRSVLISWQRTHDHYAAATGIFSTLCVRILCIHVRKLEGETREQDLKGEIMSQAKVDKYKEEKKNRKQIIAKEKRNKVIWSVVGIVIGVALILFVILSILNGLF